MSARFSALAASLVVLGLVGAGCSGDPAKPKPLKSSTAAAPSSGGGTASASASSSATASSSAAAAPSMPAAAKGTSAAAAVAFVRFYVLTLNNSSATGRTRSLAALDDGSCKSCSAIIQAIDGVYGAGGHIDSRGWKILRSSAHLHAQRAEVKVHIALPPQKVVKHRGDKAVAYKGGRIVATFHVNRTSGRWRVNGWERAS